MLEIPFVDALERLQLAQVQLFVLDAVQLQTTGLLDAGTINSSAISLVSVAIAWLAWGVENSSSSRICRSIWPL